MEINLLTLLRTVDKFAWDKRFRADISGPKPDILNDF